MRCVRILLCMCNTHRNWEIRVGNICARETNMSHMMNVVKENRTMPKKRFEINAAILPALSPAERKTQDLTQTSWTFELLIIDIWATADIKKKGTQLVNVQIRSNDVKTTMWSQCRELKRRIARLVDVTTDTNDYVLTQNSQIADILFIDI